MNQGLAAKLTRRMGVWKLFQRSLAKMDIDAAAAGGSWGGDRREGVLASPPPRGLSSVPLPPGTHCGMGEGGWDSWPGEGRWYQCLACVFSICPFVASGGGGREGAEMREVGGLAWFGCLLAAAAVWGRGHRDLGGVREPRELPTSPKRHTFFSFPIEGLIQGPLIEE